ncbi:MAG: ATP-grasp domain-containing protein, partial [Chloroflexota bacterium]
MKLHEFQAKQVLARAGIAIPEGRTATTPEDAEVAATALGLPVVVKAQVHVGGRGKAGGVKLAKTAAEAKAHATAILGMDIKGFTVRTIYVERAAKIAKELYLGITIDRDRRRAVVMLSTVGGMDIEEVAESQPEKIARSWPEPLLGLRGYAARALCFDAGVPESQREAVAAIAQKLYDVFRSTDAMTIEINPLFIQEDGSVVAGDAKLEVDDNALYRQPELAKLKETQPDE